MNVTIKIEDALCREARHRAVDRELSLAGWIAKVLRKELASAESGRRGLLDALAMEGGETPRERSAARCRNHGRKPRWDSACMQAVTCINLRRERRATEKKVSGGERHDVPTPD